MQPRERYDIFPVRYHQFISSTSDHSVRGGLVVGRQARRRDEQNRNSAAAGSLPVP